MNFVGFMKNTGRVIAHYSPAILSVAGAASVTAGTIVIVKKAKTAEPLIEANKERLEEARATGEGKQILKAHVVNGLKTTKHYAVPICLISAGVFSMLTGTIIQSRRLKLTSAALTALSGEFAAYRSRVKELIGDDKEFELYNGFKTNEAGELVRDPETGKPLHNPVSPTISMFLDESSKLYSRDGSEVWRGLQSAQSTLNALLVERAKFDPHGIGRVTGNEIVDHLGFSSSFHTQEGSVRGYIYKKGDPEIGNTVIDLRVDESLKGAWDPELFIDIPLPHCVYDTLKAGRKLSDQEKRAVIHRQVTMEGLDA